MRSARGKATANSSILSTSWAGAQSIARLPAVVVQPGDSCGQRPLHVTQEPSNGNCLPQRCADCDISAVKNDRGEGRDSVGIRYRPKSLKQSRPLLADFHRADDSAALREQQVVISVLSPILGQVPAALRTAPSGPRSIGDVGGRLERSRSQSKDAAGPFDCEIPQGICREGLFSQLRFVLYLVDCCRTRAAVDEPDPARRSARKSRIRFSTSTGRPIGLGSLSHLRNDADTGGRAAILCLLALKVDTPVVIDHEVRFAHLGEPECGHHGFDFPT